MNANPDVPLYLFGKPDKAVKVLGPTIRKVARKYSIQPELLGSVVFVEQSGGKNRVAVPNEVISEALFLLNKWSRNPLHPRKEHPPSIGLVQRQIDPKRVPGGFAGRFKYLNEFVGDPERQLEAAAALLKQIATGRYGSRFGNLGYREMGIVLTEYNGGIKNPRTPNAEAMPSDYGRSALVAMPRIKKLLGLSLDGLPDPDPVRVQK